VLIIRITDTSTKAILRLLGRPGNGVLVVRCTHKSEITDESMFEHSALPHPCPPLGKGREQDSPVSPLQGGIKGGYAGCAL
jgi:hypothetical protein